MQYKRKDFVYIAIIELGDRANEFADKIAVRAISQNVYVCNALDADDQLKHTQCFSLRKSIEGLPSDSEALQADVLESWEIKCRKE